MSHLWVVAVVVIREVASAAVAIPAAGDGHPRPHGARWGGAGVDEDGLGHQDAGTVLQYVQRSTTNRQQARETVEVLSTADRTARTSCCLSSAKSSGCFWKQASVSGSEAGHSR